VWVSNAQIDTRPDGAAGHCPTAKTAVLGDAQAPTFSILPVQPPPTKGASMRARTIFLIITIALLVGFAMLNVDEFTRVSTINLGVTTMQVPLGLAMLGITLAILVIFLVTTLYMHSASLMETRKYSKELTVQRDLADKAEASRFTELRKFIDAQNASSLQREAAATAAFNDRLALVQAAVMYRLEQSDNTTAAYIGQMQDSIARGSVTTKHHAASAAANAADVDARI
jgi:uncharacterized integral membrane protein